jgi:hypothetical protein
LYRYNNEKPGSRAAAGKRGDQSVFTERELIRNSMAKLYRRNQYHAGYTISITIAKLSKRYK